MAAIADNAMTDAVMLVTVVGTVLTAAVIDLAAIAAWLRSRWRSARN